MEVYNRIYCGYPLAIRLYLCEASLLSVSPYKKWR